MVDQEIFDNSKEARDISRETAYGGGYIENDFSDERMKTLILHTRQDAAFALLNSIEIYKITKAARNWVILSFFVFLFLLLYIVYKLFNLHS